MNIRHVWVLLPLFLTGCAGALTPFEGPDTSYRADREAVRDRPDLIPTDRILPDAELISFERRAGTTTRRDTIRGGNIASWQRMVREGNVGEEPFELRTRAVIVCDGAAVERGSFPMVSANPAEVRNPAVRSLPYVALWRPSDGTWKLERLWLAPNPPVRATHIATGCSESMRAQRESRRVVLGVAAGTGTVSDMDGVTSEFQTRTYTDLNESGSATFLPRAWLAYRVTPDWTLRLHYAGLGRSVVEMEANTEAQLLTESLRVGGHSAALQVLRRVGPVWVGAGPAVARVAADWQLSRVRRDAEPDFLTDSEAEIVPGFTVQALVRFTAVPTVVPQVAVGYTSFAGFAPHESRWSEPIDVRIQGLTFSVGLEWAP